MADIKEGIITERVRVEELAERLGTHIPDSILIEFWSLPILEALADRLEKLEALANAHGFDKGKDTGPTSN